MMKILYDVIEDLTTICVLHNITYDKDEECPMCAPGDTDEIS